MKYGSGPDQMIVWTILSLQEQVLTNTMEKYAKKKAAATAAAATGGDVDGGEEAATDDTSVDMEVGMEVGTVDGMEGGGASTNAVADGV
jgi:hypothetical protein